MYVLYADTIKYDNTSLHLNPLPLPYPLTDNVGYSVAGVGNGGEG